MLSDSEITKAIQDHIKDSEKLLQYTTNQKWVPGDTDIQGNNEADELARFEPGKEALCVDHWQLINI